MTTDADIKARILEIVGSDWRDLSVVVAAVLTTRKLHLPCTRDGCRIVAQYIYELRVTGSLDVRKVGNATGFNQIRRKATSVVASP
jgi:hypothetical protein